MRVISIELLVALVMVVWIISPIFVTPEINLPLKISISWDICRSVGVIPIICMLPVTIIVRISVPCILCGGIFIFVKVLYPSMQMVNIFVYRAHLILYTFLFTIRAFLFNFAH